ncbi:MAG: hypothetical protein JWP44_1548 [Mucilaginibacter sp.]|nr:hypothetical protein [Mucilaginibacter sp.]
MKKILLVFILTGGFYQLKAQQTAGVKPADSLAKAIMGKYVNTQPLNNYQLLNPGLHINKTLSAVNKQSLSFNNNAFYSRMPVVVLEGHDNMAIARADDHDNMPVLKIDPVNPGSMLQKSLPGLPTFIGPYSPVVPDQK